MFFHCELIRPYTWEKEYLLALAVNAGVSFWPRFSRTLSMFGHLEMRIYQKRNPLQPSAYAACQPLVTLHSSQAPPPSTNHSSEHRVASPSCENRASASEVCSYRSQISPRWATKKGGIFTWMASGKVTCETKSRIIWWWFIRLLSWFKHNRDLRSLLWLCS